MVRFFRPRLGYIATIAAVAGLLSIGARAGERLTDIQLDQLTPEQQKMVTMLVTPPRNGKITNPPFNFFARSPALGVLLLQLSDYVRLADPCAGRGSLWPPWH